MLLAMVIVPKLSSNEDVLTLNKTFIDGTLDTLTCLLFILVIVGTIEQSVPSLDGLREQSAA